MPQITLVRHGQANSAARDETSYDRLSDLGHRQAAWLGDYFQSSGERFARVYCGTLTRHRETVAGLGLTQPVTEDARLNEIEYFTLATLMEQQHGIAIPTDREGFIDHLPRLFGMWRDGALDGAPEAFDSFEARVNDCLTELAAGDGNALVVTSGGLIGMAMRLTLQLDMQALASCCLAIQNTSLSRWMTLPAGLSMTQFNATPHLDTIDRRHAQTHI